MIWIGGAPGAGKSTIARTLASSRDLPLQAVDLWTYDHVARMPPAEPLDDELARGPEAAADAFAATSRARIGLIVDDVSQRGRNRVPAIVEGPQLLPELAEPLPPWHGVWLLPDPERTRNAREQRLSAASVAADRQRLAGLLGRDAVLGARVRAACRDRRLAGVEVPANPDWPGVTQAVEGALRTALEASPRLEPGAVLGRQRRLENLAACRQLRLWQKAEGLSSLPPYPFACECGRSGCTLQWSGTPDGYDRRSETGAGLVEAS